MTGTAVANVNDLNDRMAVAHTDKIQPFIPDGFASVLKFSELISMSGMAPKDMKTPDQVAVAIFHGLELGLTPMAALQSIAVINGRPSIWGDGALAVVRASGELEEFEEIYEGGSPYAVQPTFDEFGKVVKAGTPNPEYKAICRIKRKGRPAKDYEFSVMDAIEAGLYNKEGPWRQYRKRMLKMRARSFALRDEFTDIMRGMALAEEVQDYDIDATAITHEREEPPAQPGAAADTPAGKRPRKKADNKYHGDGADGGAKDNVEDAHVISETAAKGKVDTNTAAGNEEDPPADNAKKAEPEKAKPTSKPAEKAAPDAKAEAILVRDAILEEIGADKDLKAYIVRINDLLAPFNTMAEMKAAWDGHERMKGVVGSQRPFIDRMRDFHKQRIEKILQDEEPPADATGKGTGKGTGKATEFDHAGFLHELDVKLGAEKTPDDVNRVYQELTAEPVKEGIFTAQQIEDDLKPLLAGHLERTDFGS